MVTSEALAEVLQKYTWVADAVRAFKTGAPVSAYFLAEAGVAHPAALETEAVEEDEEALDAGKPQLAGLRGSSTATLRFLMRLRPRLAALNVPLELLKFNPEVGRA